MQPDLEMPRFGKDATAAVELNGEPAPKRVQNCSDLALVAREAFEPHTAPNRHAHRADDREIGAAGAKEMVVRRPWSFEVLQVGEIIVCGHSQLYLCENSCT